jgi:NifU-like protein involved in Fe-S cluster formation
MASAAALYTPEVLALATSLAAFPMEGALPLRGEARSASCGSTLALGLALDEAGAIAQVGLAAHACAIGQAAAAIFANAAIGQTPQAIVEAEAAIAGWLSASARGEVAALPAWPGLNVIAAAAAFPARHGAILLAWRAALAALALSTQPTQG